jgi:pyruvate/2-oxoglutarate dehydrogenase complex dihydrolipoamide dehydrogenase (E3) component/uncharacterized membrane protein YdjX (TVP38/TMEM64 family)
MKPRKLVAVALVVALLLAFFVFDLGRFFSLDFVKAQQASLATLYAERPALVLGVYAAVYVLVFALALPAGAVMTLVGGAVFGPWVGTVVVSFASSLGALLAFWAARTLLRETVQRRFAQRLAEVDRGVARDGAFYLFTLRLIPAIPPAAINLLFGLTAMRAFTFYWVSQLGMLAGTLVYVNAGTQLAGITSLRGLVSPQVVGSLVLLGLFPLVAKKVVAMVRARRGMARWAGKKPRRFDRNLVVIGAGSAGLVTAYIAAAVRAKVTLVERHQMGGDCLNTGCVPSKALIRTATLAAQMRRADALGLAPVQPQVDFGAVMDRVAQVVRDIAPHDSVERYTGLGVDVQLGTARIVDPWRVEITAADGSQQTLATRAIVVATGAKPAVPSIPGFEAIAVLTSDNLWNLRTLPPRLLVLGGGPIGCEIAQAFARLGSAVTQVELLPRLLAREEPEASAAVQAALEADGVRVLCGHRALRVEPEGDGHVLVAEAGGAEHRIPFDRLLCAVGRSARLDGFGLQEVGVATGRVIQTDEFLQTSVPTIYAAGDAAGPWQLTHAGAHQAWYAAVNALFGGFRRFAVDGRVIPACTFTEPEVARVGLTVAEAAERGVAVEVTRYGIDDLDRAIADGAAHGFVQVLTAPGSDRVLGVTVVGAHAGELIAEWVLAMKHGLGLNKILGTIHVYPTLAEANKYAAGAWKRAHAPEGLLRWVERFHAWRRG